MAECARQVPGGMKLPGKGGVVLSGVCEELSGGEGSHLKRKPGNKFQRETGERAQSVKDLPCRYENLSSDLQNPRKKSPAQWRTPAVLVLERQRQADP